MLLPAWGLRDRQRGSDGLLRECERCYPLHTPTDSRRHSTTLRDTARQERQREAGRRGRGAARTAGPAELRRVSENRRTTAPSAVGVVRDRTRIRTRIADPRPRFVRDAALGRTRLSGKSRDAALGRTRRGPRSYAIVRESEQGSPSASYARSRLSETSVLGIRIRLTRRPVRAGPGVPTTSRTGTGAQVRIPPRFIGRHDKLVGGESNTQESDSLSYYCST